MTPRKLIALVLALSLTGCGLKGYKIAAVSLASANATLILIQQAEIPMVCGKPTASLPPYCVTKERHKEIHIMLERAFALDRDAALLAAGVDPTKPVPPQVPIMIGNIARIVNDVMRLIPNGPERLALEQRIRGR